jgi:hypothetical protein
MSKDPNAKVTVLLMPPDVRTPRLAVKIATTASAGTAVEREARLLVDLRRMCLGTIGSTIPRFVQMCDHSGHPALVATAVAGTPLAMTYNSWPHTARPGAVSADFAAAGDWLTRFQDASTTATGPVHLLDGVGARLLELGARRRSVDDAALADRVAARVGRIHARLSTHSTPRTAVHGDYWFGNLLLDGAGSVVGVVDWEAGCSRGEPLKDVGRFLVSYSLYLDRHTAVGRRVAGHHGLRADHSCAGVRYGFTGTGWYPRLVRRFLVDALVRLGLPGSLWYDVAQAAVADVAATADDDGFAWQHVRVLDELPDLDRRVAP